jgi:hypothetical protein
MGRRRRLALAAHRRPKQVVCPFEDIALPSRFREIVRLQGLADKRSPLIEIGNSLWNPTPIVIDAVPKQQEAVLIPLPFHAANSCRVSQNVAQFVSQKLFKHGKPKQRLENIAAFST